MKNNCNKKKATKKEKNWKGRTNTDIFRRSKKRIENRDRKNIRKYFRAESVAALPA